MSEREDSGPGRREVAHRLFAAEFDDAEFSYSESDEERAPNYVVTPTGARVNRLFVVGVLTELEQVNDEVLRARIVGPTGPFVVYAGQYQPEALAFLEAATPPLFVAVTGKARTFEPEDGDRVFTSIRPESISEVDAETRDRWVVQAAEQTLERVGLLAGAKESGLSGDQLRTALAEAGVDEATAAGVTLALDYYGTTGDYLQAVRDLARNATEVVAGERDEAGSLSRSPGDGTDDPLAALSSVDLAAPTTDAAASSADATTDTAASSSSASDDGEPLAETAATATETDSAADASAPTDPDTSSDSDASEPVGDSASVDDQAAAEPSDPADTSTATDATASTGSAEPTATESTATESADTTEPATTGSDDTDSLGDFDSDDGDDDVGEFDPEFELDEDEREEIEQEYGTDFQSGSEVQEPGEADIDTPDPEELAEMEADAEAAGDATPAESAETADASPETETAAAGGETAEPDDTTAADASTAETDDSGAEPDEDVDLEDAVMDVMTELNDGSGAERDAVRSTVVDRHGAAPDEVDDAIQDALMGGRCYEPEDGKLTPI